MEAVTHRKAKPHMARLMAHDSLKRRFAVHASSPVIPAKAGIQLQFKQRATSTTALDTRLRGYDGIQWVDSAEAWRVGV